jgi:hypothetical protein
MINQKAGVISNSSETFNNTDITMVVNSIFLKKNMHKFVMTITKISLKGLSYFPGLVSI